MRKANVFKKALSGVMALTTALSIGFFAGCSCNPDEDGGLSPEELAEQQAHNAFIDEIGGVSETYKGTLSSGNYYLETDAAAAYIANEVSYDAEVVSVQKVKALNANEVAALNIPTTEAIEGVEQYVITYTEDEFASMSTAPADSKTATVYLILFESRHWEYFAPCPTTGDTITKSYYDSVFNSEAYVNCTYTNTMDMTMAVSASSQGQTMTMSMSMSMLQTMKYAEDKIYLEQTITTTSKMEMPGYPEMSENETETNTIAAYIEEVGGRIVCKAKVVEDDYVVTNWTEIPLYNIGFNSVEDLTPFATGYLDYSYFTKTDFGFELSGDQAQRYLTETLSQLSDYEELINQMNIKTIVKYYVQNGALTGMRQDLDISYNGNMEGASANLTLTLVAKGTVKDYGTTAVEKPTELVE